jgi:hypothetical protein
MTTIAQSISAFGCASVFAMSRQETHRGPRTTHFSAESTSQFGSVTGDATR